MAAIATYNRDDFLELDRRYRTQNRPHCGIVVLNPRRFPQGPASVGPLITSLDQLIAAGPPYESFIHWLQRPADGFSQEPDLPAKTPRINRKIRTSTDDLGDLQTGVFSGFYFLSGHGP